MTTRVFVALVIAVTTIAGGMMPVAQASETDSPSEKVRIIIPPFRKVAGADKFGELSAHFPVLLRVALMSYDWMDVALAPRTPESGDWLLSSSFAEFGGNFRVISSLSSGEKTARVDSVAFESGKVFEGMQTLALNLAATLGRARKGLPQIRSVGVGCLEDRSKQKGRAGDGLARDVGMIIVDQLRARYDVRVFDRGAGKICDSGAPQVSAEGLDARIGGAVSLEGRSVTIAPEVFVIERNVRIFAPEISGSLDEYLTLRRTVANSIKDLFSALLTTRGEWARSSDFAFLSGRSPAETYLELGRKNLVDGKTSLAVVFLQKAIERNAPAEARYLLGVARVKQQRLEDAAREFEGAQSIAAAQRELGRVYFRLGESDAAIRAYERALALDPSLLGVEIEIGDVHASRPAGRGLSEAKKFYELAQRKNANDPVPYQRLAVLLEQRDGRAGGAEKVALLTKALEVDPNFGPARAALGAEYSRRATEALWRDRYGDAVTNFTREIEYTPTAGAYYGRALSRSMIAAGRQPFDFNSAIGDYRAALALIRTKPTATDPDLDWVTLALAELQILQGYYSDARTQLDEFIAQGSRQKLPVGWFLAAVAEMLRGGDGAKETVELRRELREQQALGQVDWSFSLLESVVGANAAIDAATRRSVIELSSETRKAFEGAAKVPRRLD